MSNIKTFIADRIYGENYFKDSSVIYAHIDSDNNVIAHSGKSTKSEMKKRGVDLDTCTMIENNIQKIEIIRAYNTRGEFEYGSAVQLLCTTVDGYKIMHNMDIIDFIDWVKETDVTKNSMTSDFTFIYFGQLCSLVKRHDTEYTSFYATKEKTEKYYAEKRNATKDIQIGDIISTPEPYASRFVYLGQYFYTKPNLKRDNFVNKMAKFHFFIPLNADNSLKEKIIFSTKPQPTSHKVELTNQGQLDGFNADTLINNAKQYFEKEEMRQLNKGFKKVDTYYSKGYKAFEEKNKFYFTLAHIGKTKETTIIPTKETVVAYQWLCNLDDWTWKTKKPETLERITAYDEINRVRYPQYSLISED